MKSILFNTDMVRAILDGRKTETRRVLAEKEHLDKKHGLDREPYKSRTGEWCVDKQTDVDDYRTCVLKPRYQPGDILYVRETWAYGYVDTTDFECRHNECFFEELKAGTKKDSFLMPRYFYRTENLDGINVRWRPSIHMPKEAARLFLRVTGVRVERLQDMTDKDALKEGAQGVKCDHAVLGAYGCTDCMNTGWLEPPALEFVESWNSTIKKSDIDSYGWEANPWVWVIEFERIGREEAMSEEHHDD